MGMDGSDLRHAALKAYQRANRNTFPDNLDLRVHRALSWLKRAEQCADDPDGQFIFLWIAFNAAYAHDTGRLSSASESRKLSGFMEKLHTIDKDKEIYELIWTRYAQGIRLLLDNKYVFQPFWDYQNGVPGADDWQARFKRHQAAAHKALAAMDTAKLLSIIFSSLYTLRNQLIHGGATWNGRVNREQVELGRQILGEFVPIIIDLMMRNPGSLWGDPCYPVVD